MFNYRLNLKQSIVTALITIVLFNQNANSDPPPLPPALPEAEKQEVNKDKQNSQKTDSFLKKIFGPKQPESQLVQPRNQEVPAGNDKEILDLPSVSEKKKLPTLENENVSRQKKAINSIPAPLDKENSNKIIKQENEDIDNLIPSLPIDSQNNLDPSLPIMDSKETHPSSTPLQDEPQNLESEHKIQTLPEIKTIITPIPTTEKIPISELPANEQEKNESLIPRLEDLSSPVPVPAITPTPQDHDFQAEKLIEETDDNIKIEKAEPTSPEQFLDQDKTSGKPQVQTPVPVLVKENKQIPLETGGDEATKNIIIKEEKPKIKEQKLLEKKPSVNKPNTNTENSIEKIAILKKTEELDQFSKDETQMLLLPNDDIVLGKLTYEAKIEQMDIRSFIALFKPVYGRQKREEQRKKINNFINNYSMYFRFANDPVVNDVLIENAFEGVRKNDLFTLRALVDNYPILQKQGYDYTLLHQAAELGHYYIAKFLIIRGINVKILDRECRTALEIADKENNNIACLIRKTMGSQISTHRCQTGKSCLLNTNN